METGEWEAGATSPDIAESSQCSLRTKTRRDTLLLNQRSVILDSGECICFFLMGGGGVLVLYRF